MDRVMIIVKMFSIRGVSKEVQEERAVFRSGQIDRPVIYRFAVRSDAVTVSKAALGINRPGFMW
jgi:hypothetical protein